MFFIIGGLYGPADHPVRGALLGLGGLVVHAFHEVRGGCLGFLSVFMVLLIMQFAMHLLALAV